jgi:DNA polymerase III delta prime subunit
MQSVIILSKTKEKAKEEALSLCKGENVSKFDVNYFQNEKAIGVADIKLLQKNLFLTPIKGDKKAIIIDSFLGITNEAQNAFLKTLEEPPKSTIILILANSLDIFLPTILSRCTLINLETKKILTKGDISKYSQILKDLEKGSVSNALKISEENSKDKETALQFLENLIICENLALHETSNSKMLKKMQKTYTIIKTTNVSARFALENLFLNLYNKMV